VDLSAKGEEEAKEAGQMLKDGGYDFDIAYTSVLRRAIRTCWFVVQRCQTPAPSLPALAAHPRSADGTAGLSMAGDKAPKCAHLVA
jgi:2,3-bisphosphoglycerate-dependent phosphoglycerate mutase